ncbi:MAG: hypothetical protein AMK70_13585 [Nitrospira bacterium SG8_35_1]|jgi:hypothetical protein|nr:MAG: hypothetical protein AMK70_13585 [Nitrospira bacterium SG8_35_1]
MGTEGKNKKHMFDNPRNVQRVLYGLFASLVLLLAIEPFIHGHPYFVWEEWFGFYAIYGFVACVLLVLAAKYILRPFVKRDEDYYD